MLGRLCKYLRICGFDTLYSNEGIKALLQARQEGRIFLTRNRQLKDKDRVFFIESESLPIQLGILFREFHLEKELSPFSRCLCCNELLTPVEKENIRNYIPFYTYRNFNEFARCPRCQRVYWKGSHYQKMVDEIKTLIG